MALLHTTRRLGSIGLLLLAQALLLAAPSSGYAAANLRSGAVYTETNATSGNAVLAYSRAADGTLTAAGSISTGGLGTGAGLGSQGALALSQGGQWLFAVNAGSNDISSFRVESDGLTLLDRVSSGGTMPISLTVNGSLLYVLNAGGAGTISGFKVGPQGALSPLATSTRTLSGAGPAEVAFSPEGRALVVTEKAANAIEIFPLGHDGLAGQSVSHASSGATPFGFDFGQRDTLIVSEASGGVSSYGVSHGEFDVITPSAPTHQVAACWLVVTGNGRYAYTANAGSGSISGFRVDSRGQLSALDANGITGATGAGSHPIDEALSRDSHYLYSVLTGTGGMAAFQVQADGSLSALPFVSGIPTSAAGLAAS